MTPDERSYQRLARWMDGESVELTREERGLARQLRSDESTVGQRLGVGLPAAAADRARRRMRWHQTRRLRRGTAGVAVAAALLLLATLLTREPPRPPVSGASVESMLAAVEPTAQQARLDELQREVEALAADLDEPTASPWELDEIEHELDDLLQPDASEPPAPPNRAATEEV